VRRDTDRAQALRRKRCGVIAGRIETGVIAVVTNGDVGVIDHLVEVNCAGMGTAIGQNDGMTRARVEKGTGQGSALSI
jgi:hypothetical protein